MSATSWPPGVDSFGGRTIYKVRSNLSCTLLHMSKFLGYTAPSWLQGVCSSGLRFNLALLDVLRVRLWNFHQIPVYHYVGSSPMAMVTLISFLMLTVASFASIRITLAIESSMCPLAVLGIQDRQLKIGGEFPRSPEVHASYSLNV
jgi:hypothetical protein